MKRKRGMPDSASIFNDLIRRFGFLGMDIKPPDRTAAQPEHGKSGNRTLLRVVAWGVCASLAAAVMVFVAQTPAGGERINQALERVEPTATPADGEPMLRALEARIAALTSDRDRLAKRVAALESGVSDLTGSVRGQASSTSSTSSPPAPAPVATAPALPAVMIVAVAPPLINPLATPPAGVASILPETATPRHVEPPTDIATPQKASTDAMVPESGPMEASAKDETPTGSIPTEPERKPADVPKPASHQRPQAEFGVELGTEANMDGLRKRWAGVKANYGPLLVGLSPVAVRDQHPGSSNVRLVAGPLPSLAAARQLCARFARVNGDCWPARINPAEVVQR
jgi:hypothetical protein